MKNITTPDRIIRIVFAIVATILYINGNITGTTAIIILALGGIFLITALINFCPIYFGFKKLFKSKTA